MKNKGFPPMSGKMAKGMGAKGAPPYTKAKAPAMPAPNMGGTVAKGMKMPKPKR